MAVNPRPELPNRHALILARSGGGKSQVTKQATDWPQTGVRCVLWDPARDHARGTHYGSTPEQFRDLLAGALSSGRGFRVAYDGERSPKLFEWWCALVWRMLDGRVLTYCVVEELKRVCPTPGEATPYHGRLLEEGRKFGLVYRGTSQRPQSVTKTAYDNCGTLYIGPNGRRAANMLQDQTDIPADQIAALPDLHFLKWRDGAPVEAVNVPYRR